MNPKSRILLGTFSALAVAGSMLLTKTASAQTAPVEDVQILTRGPVHEAFAESVSFDPVAGVIVSTRVPDAIEEIPPEQQLEGDNVTWISGYWAWDDDQNDFIWISGIWRNLPPGRQWVPGYWNEIDEGQSQWTSGYWADSEESEVSYVSAAPPRNIDVGPNTDAPSANHSWIPGNWMWADTRYAWRTGYWAPQRQNWTWVPSRYNWSRRGYIYVDGYWDHAVARRGVLFAPVSFHDNYYNRPDYYYTPSVVVALNVFSSHLFIRPRYSHYYFGDYYAPRYRDSGFYASYSWQSGRHGYDPIYAYDRWDHRGDQGWERQRRDDFNYFRDNEEARPAHTWAAMRDSRQDRYTDGRNRNYATPLSGYVKDSKSGQRFRNIDEGRRKEYASQGKEIRKFSQERRQTETRGIAAGGSTKMTASREKLARSPISGREEGKFAKNDAPPKRPEARGDKAKLAPAGKNKNQNGVVRRDEAKDAGKRQDGANANERRNERGVTSRDDEARDGGKTAAPGQNRDGKSGKAGSQASRQEGKGDNNSNKPKANERDGKSGKADNQVPRQDSKGDKDSNKPKTGERDGKANEQDRSTPDRKNQVMPKREAPQKSQVRETPKRNDPNKAQTAPKRETQPKSQVRETPKRNDPNKAQSAPKRESQPKPQARPAPERKPQASPKRESQPKPQVRKAPQREAQPKAQPRPEPQRKQQAAPKREAPKQQSRQAPQRQSQPKQQARQTPQRQPQAAPQGKPSSPQKKNSKAEEEAAEKKGKGLKQ